MNVIFFNIARFNIARLRTIFLLLISLSFSYNLDGCFVETKQCNFGVGIATELANSNKDTETLKHYMRPYNQDLYNTIDREIEALREYQSQNHGLNAVLDGEIFFTRYGQLTPAASIAPTTYHFLKDIISDITIKGHIAMPDIALHVNKTPQTINEYAFNAYAVSAIYPNFIAVDEELLKLFLWNKQAKALLHAILAHELGHIKFQHGASEIKNEHQADAFAIGILDKPTMLIKSLDLTMLAGSLYFALHQNTHHHIRNTAQTTRVLANYAIETLPKLGTLSKAKTNKAFMYIINITIKQPIPTTNIHNHGSFPDKIMFDLTHHMKDNCTNKFLMRDANNQFSADVGKETHPSPFARRRYIKACMKAKKNKQAFPVAHLKYIDDMGSNNMTSDHNSLEELFDVMEEALRDRPKTALLRMSDHNPFITCSSCSVTCV